MIRARTAVRLRVYSVRFEGYGPHDTAVLVACLTNDRAHAAAAVRAAFLANGGWLGAPGSVAYLFNEIGRLVYAAGPRVESLARLAWEAGAEDVARGRDGGAEVRTDPVELGAVRSRLARAGFSAAVSEIVWRAAVAVHLEGVEADRMRGLLEALERLDDVQSIYTNAEVAGEVLASVRSRRTPGGFVA